MQQSPCGRHAHESAPGRRQQKQMEFRHSLEMLHATLHATQPYTAVNVNLNALVAVNRLVKTPAIHLAPVT